jgi:hypothetical protein
MIWFQRGKYSKVNMQKRESSLFLEVWKDRKEKRNEEGKPEEEERKRITMKDQKT